MNRLPALDSLQSIANAYDKDDISDEKDLESRLRNENSPPKPEGEELVKSKMKVENSDYNIVVSDGEENLSGAGSVKNAVVINQPKVNY